jgi:hypothetical protein
MEQIELIRHAVRTLDALAVPYVLVGSWGSGLYGEPRFTRDVDIVLDLGLAVVPRFCAAFPCEDFYLSGPITASFSASAHVPGPTSDARCSTLAKTGARVAAGKTSGSTTSPVGASCTT